MALFGIIPDKKAATPQISAQGFQYGGSAANPGAQQAVKQYAGSAAAYQGQSAQAQNRANPGAAQDATAANAAAFGRGAASAAAQNTDQARAQQLAAYGRQQQGSDALSAFAARPEGPSAAQAQLQQGANQSFQQQLAMARSGSGSSGGASALRGAAFQQAGIMGQANSQAAQLKAQEDQAYRQQQLQALGAAQQGYAAEASTAQGLRGSDVNAAQLQAQTALQGGQLAAQTNLGIGQQNMQQGAINDTYSGNLNNLGLQYNQLANVVNQDQLQANMGFQSLASGQGLSNNQFNAGVSNASTQGDIGLGEAALGAAAMMSDSDAKRDKVKAQGVAEALGALGGGSSGGGGFASGMQLGGALRNKWDADAAQDQADTDRSAAIGQGAGQAALSSSLATPGTPTLMQPPQMSSYSPSLYGAPSYGDPALLSDTESKRNAERAQGAAHALAALGHPVPTARFPDVDMRAAQNYTYSYKDPSQPGAAPGRQVGPMAQDLEQTAAAPAVLDTPQGKMVDPGRLAMVTAGAVGEQQRAAQDRDRDIADLQRQIAALGGRRKPAGTYDRLALDDAHAREMAYR